MKAGAALVAACALVPATASATTYEGTCDDIAGTATFGAPLKSEASKNTYDFVGSAHCTGKIDGKAVDKAEVDIHVAGEGNLSCSQGASTTPGKGTITVKSTGVVIGFTMDFTSTLSEVDITLHGLKSGSGTGHASFLQDDPAANLTTVQNCGGDGNKSLAFTANATTDTPFDDGKTAGTSTSSGGGSSTPSSGGGDTSSGAPANDTSGSSTPQSSDQPKAKPKAKKKHKAKKKKSKKSKKKHKKKKGKKH